MVRSSPVILLTVDTLRADRFTERFFPESMPIIESDFARFPHAYSHGNSTPLAFPGIVSGHPAIGNGLFPDSVPTIAELFDDATIGFANNGHLTEKRGYDRGFDLFHDQYPPDQDRYSKKGVVEAWKQRVIDHAKSVEFIRESNIVKKGYRRVERAGARLTGKDPYELEMPAWPAEEVTDFVLRRISARDTFIWGHYMDPHKPFVPLQSIEGYSVDRSPEEIRHLNSYVHEKDPLPPEEMAILERLYESNIRYFDRSLAWLFERLQEKGWYEASLIIVVGDHGELFGEHGCMFHPMDIDPVDQLVETPLVVKYPNGRHASTEFTHAVQHGDILPTIAEVIGTSPSGIPDGIYPLTQSTPRSIISKSNTSIRLTEEDGVAIRRRDGTEECSGSITEAGKEKLESASFPTVETNSGEVKGVEAAERLEQLEALGYR